MVRHWTLSLSIVKWDTVQVALSSFASLQSHGQKVIAWLTFSSGLKVPSWTSILAGLV